MSINQSRAEKSEAHLRKPGRSGSSGQHRGFSGGGGGKGGGGGSAPPPPSSVTPASPSSTPALSTNRSLKKSGNGQGVQSRVTPKYPSSETAVAANSALPNGAHGQVPLHGSSHAPARPAAPSDLQPVDTSVMKNSRALPKAPGPLPAAGAPPDSAAPKTPSKGDASRAFTLQFGTINPGIMNGMQIPARTSSAPPNLDEQKRDQARHDSFRAVPTLPIPAPQKQQQQQTRKDVGLTQTNMGEPHPPTQTKRDLHVPIPSASIVAPTKSSVLPTGGMHMPMPYQQPQAPPQFGGPNPQIHSQGVASSLQMAMSLPMGNAPQVPHQMFIPSIHSHPLQTQAMMHQGQGLGFAPQIGHQLAPQLGNLGIGIAPQYPQQQPGKFGGQRKSVSTVKITHPDTHQEVKLDEMTDSYMVGSSSGQRLLPNLTPQSQPISTFVPPHQINYYPPPNSYFFSSTLPLTSTQMTTGLQAPRYSYPVSQGGQALSFINQSVYNPMPSSKPGPPPPLQSVSAAVNLEGLPVSAPSAPVSVTVKPAVSSFAEKVVTPSSVTISRPPSKVEAPKLSKAEPSLTTSMPFSKAEAPKLLNPSGDATASQLQRDKETGPKSPVQQPKSASGPSDNLSSALEDVAIPSGLSTQCTHPETSSSGPVTPVGDSGSVTADTDGGKREPVRRSESSKEYQKKLSKMDIGQSQQQHQADALDLADDIKLSSSKVVKDSGTEDMFTQQVSKDSDSIQAVIVADLSTSTASVPSPSVALEASFSSGVGTSEAVEAQAISIVSGSSGVILEKEASQEGPLGCTVELELAPSGSPVKERDPSETSPSLDPEIDGTVSKYSDSSFRPDEISSMEVEQKQEPLVAMERVKVEVSNDSSLDFSNAKIYPFATVTESTSVKQDDAGVEKSENEIASDLNDGEKQQHDTYNESAGFGLVVDRTAERLDASSDFSDADSASSSRPTSANADAGKPSTPDSLTNVSEIMCSQDVGLSDPVIPPLETALVPTSISSEATQKPGGKVTELPSGDPVSVLLSGPKDKPSLDPTRTKATAGRKKKRKEFLSKADAAGTSDLYNAYKGPEEKKEVASSSESIDSSSMVDAEHVPIDGPDKGAVTSGEGQNKAELDDWEDAADISTPKLRSLEQQGHGASEKRYSRDFLLTFAEQCIELPIGFETGSDVADVLSVPLGTSRVVDREQYPSSGRIIDRPSGAARVDRRMVGVMDDGKWTKSPGSFGPGGDIRMDAGHGVTSSRPGQGVNHGVLRNPRGQPPNHLVGGILSGPIQFQASHGGIQRNNADADRWQRLTPFQRGLIASPQTPLQVMHKAERKYEVGKVSDIEEAKQRQLKGILNKLTPQNFDKLFAQVTEVNIDNTITLTGVISQIFDKALMEPTFCEMYANFCYHLAGALPELSEDNEKITFRRLLLNKCQEEFERGEREQAEAEKIEEEGEIKQSEEQREEKRIQARRRMLGNIRLIGELYKKKMLTERIMHECIKKLLGQHQNQNPDEEDIEALCKLMSTIGEMIDHPKAKEHMDAYFDMMQKLSANQKLSSRVRFMLRDSIDLRRNKWQQRRKVEGPKKIEEVHRDAAQERQAQSSRLSRGPGIASAQRRGPSVDYGPRGSSVLSSTSSQQIGGIRNFPPQARGYTQDVRSGDRHQFESRTLSVPLLQKPIDDDSITLGPQGGLARGMSIRGQPLISNAPSAEIHPSIADTRRTASGPNGYSSTPDRASYNSREEILPRSMPDKVPGTTTTPSAGQIHGPWNGSQNAPSEAKTLSEEDLRVKSISAIREFYSAKNEEEVTLCMKELNSPGFYSSMVSLWVTDSFERKDMERDLLARLLVNLCKSRDSLLSHIQLIQGFESVLSSLEDAVNDAPKAAEFLGHIFAKAVLEDVVSLREIGKLIHEGGEEPGRLVEVGLASEVLGSILELVRTEKGGSALNEIRISSDLRLEDFRPPHPIKSKKLDAFL